LETLEDTKHDKFKLRVASWKRIITDGTAGLPVYTLMLYWMMKSGEMAKFNKYPRVVVDCNTENSLPRVSASATIKENSYESYVFDDIECQYSVPGNNAGFNEVFDMSWDSNRRVFINHNSDDSLLTINPNLGARRVYNVDIAANDSSHTLESFVTYSKFYGLSDNHHANLMGIVTSPFTIRSAESYRKVIMRPKPGFGYLPSGIGDTTPKNNFTWVCLAYQLSIFQHPINDIYDVVYCFYLIGMRLTFEECFKKADMQLLKNSPCDGFVMPNLAILFKYSGVCKQRHIPLPARHKNQDYETQLMWYQTYLTYAYFKRYRYKPLMPLCPFFDELHKSGYIDHVKYSHKTVILDEEVFYPTRDDVYGRYDLGHDLILEFESLVSLVGLRRVISHPLVDEVMRRDYGL